VTRVATAAEPADQTFLQSSFEIVLETQGPTLKKKGYWEYLTSLFSDIKRKTQKMDNYLFFKSSIVSFESKRHTYFCVDHRAESGR